MTEQRIIEAVATGSRARVTGRGRTIMRSDRAVNTLFDDRVVAVLARGGTPAPSNIILDADRVPPVDEVEATPEGLRSEGLLIPLGGEIDLRVDPRPVREEGHLLEAIAPHVRPSRHSIMAAVYASDRGEDIDASGLERAVLRYQVEALRSARGRRQLAERLVGSGYGLTPSGDDFVLGLVAVMHMEGEDTSGVRRAVQNYRNPLGRTMLLDGLDGHFSLPVKNLLEASTGSVDGRLVGEVLGLGHTSGLDTLAGMYYALQRRP